MLDLTPDTGAGEEVNIGDDVPLTCTLDVQVARADLTLEIKGATTITKTGIEIEETDNGDGTFTYRYVHPLDAKTTTGSWTLTSSSAGNARGTFFIKATP